MLRGLERRLDRLWDAHQREKGASDSIDRHRRFVEIVRGGLRRAGVDPAKVHSMAIYEPGNLFAPLMQPRRPPPPTSDSQVERMRQKLLAIVERCREQPLDLDKATPFELFAMYCFVPDRPGVAYIKPEVGEIVGASAS